MKELEMDTPKQRSALAFRRRERDKAG